MTHDCQPPSSVFSYAPFIATYGDKQTAHHVVHQSRPEILQPHLVDLARLHIQSGCRLRILHDLRARHLHRRRNRAPARVVNHVHFVEKQSQRIHRKSKFAAFRPNVNSRRINRRPHPRQRKHQCELQAHLRKRPFASSRNSVTSLQRDNGRCRGRHRNQRQVTHPHRI